MRGSKCIWPRRGSKRPNKSPGSPEAALHPSAPGSKPAEGHSPISMRGVHIRALQELPGHKTLAMTQRYSHLAPEQLQNAVKLLDGVIGEKRELIGQVSS